MAQAFLRAPSAFDVPGDLLESVLIEDLYLVRKVTLPHFILEQELGIPEEDGGVENDMPQI